jgi:hypothetical protein
MYAVWTTEESWFNFLYRGKELFFSSKGLNMLWSYLAFYSISSGEHLPILNLPGRSQWPRGLRLRSTAACLLRSWVRISPGAWMSVCCDCCVLSGRGLCDGLITRPEESYRLCCVTVYDIETPSMRTQTSIHCDWNLRGLLAGGGLITLSLQVRLPAITLAYRVRFTLIVD